MQKHIRSLSQQIKFHRNLTLVESNYWLIGGLNMYTVKNK
jgi:hypothetical protein